jgi:tRNA threonylcarbamoyladenosine biosynthesis protein TsaB
MEVFMAVYDRDMKEIIPPCALILQSGSFDSMLEAGKIVFAGSGSAKLKNMIVHKNAIFNNSIASAIDMIPLSAKKNMEKNFVNLSYVEPFYIKEFYSPAHI